MAQCNLFLPKSLKFHGLFFRQIVQKNNLDSANHKRGRQAAQLTHDTVLYLGSLPDNRVMFDFVLDSHLTQWII